MTTFVYPLAGGALIGVAAGLFYLAAGRIAGVSGVAAGLLTGGERAWRLLFLAGLLCGGLLVRLVAPEALAWTVPRSWPWLLAAGLLVGIGTSLANGCTSGHGVCGIGRLSPRSTVAVCVFMAFGVATAAAVTHLAGGVL